MFGVFNMGIGMAVVVSADNTDLAVDILQENGEAAVVIGTVSEHEGVRFING